MSSAFLLVTFGMDERSRAIVAEAFGDAEVVYLTDVAEADRPAVLTAAGALFSRNIGEELRPEELPLIAGARLLQSYSAGVDYIPLQALPPELPVAVNGGAFAEPMAEHAMAMTLAAAKRLFVEQEKLRGGEFNQFTTNRMLAGGVCGILGFGGIGVATARLARCFGMKIHAISRRGRTDAAVDWIGTPDAIETLLAAADVLVLSLPLTRATVGLIGARALSSMKPDAILVNLARGEIVDEDALYAHLQANPRFTACLDAWWTEPVRHGRFEMRRPFLDLPNVIASPHNSASVRGAGPTGLRRAIANCRRALSGETPLHLIGDDERMM